jgi:histone acetyltransferase (RNA polymerase elongator complex component)
VIVPVFLPHLGCRQRCIYCNQHHITGKNRTPNLHEGMQEELRQTIDEALGRIGRKSEVAIYGGNPFGLGAGGLAHLLSLFANYTEKITSMRLSTEPIVPDMRMIELLKEYKVTTVELGIPVFSDEKLRALGRHHTVRDLYDTFEALIQAGFSVGLQVMIGLPGETAQDTRLTVEHLLRLKPGFIRVYPLIVIRDTRLHEVFNEGIFRPLSVAEAVLRALFIYLNAEAHGIKVIRMGLSENEFLKREIVGGPYHPSFGYLVRSEAFYLAITRLCKERTVSGQITVWISRRDVPHVTGYRRSNLARLEAQGLRVTWIESDIPAGHFKIETRGAAFQGNMWDAIPMIPL